jgi:hypothetical protein
MKINKQSWNEVIFPVLVIIGAIIMFIVISIFLFTDKGYGKTADPISEVSFDHSNCQYPNRLSNPPDGCDNSDPARPECMKIGIEDCDLPLQDGSTPILTPKVAPAASESVEANKCED